MIKPFLFTPILCYCALIASCALPPVNISTPEPLQVDINVRLDVHQHQNQNQQKEEPAATESTEELDTATAEKRRRNRMGELQLLKNNRIVGENRNGMVEIINKPPGEYGEYAENVVKDENADRLVLMKATAAEEAIGLEKVKLQHAKLWRDRSFNGEWIEMQQDDGSWKWTQKSQGG